MVSPPRLALAAKGFRPFFLLAALFAVAVVPLWLLVIVGLVRPNTYVDPTTWHAHEMVFGFVGAVIAGFLLTAIGNWTQRETLVGWPLVALSGVWVLGRAGMALAGSLPRGLPALLDLLFLPLLIAALARPLVAAKNRRNFVMLLVLAALFAANVVVHLDALGFLPLGSARRACLVGIDVVVLVVLIIAGRVFPMFTRNATGVTTIRSVPFLDVGAVAAMALLTVAGAFAPDTRLTATLAGIAAVLAAARAMRWGGRHSVRHPMLWILHAGYVWLTLGLLLRAAAGFGFAVPGSLATHALTVGAVGSISLGMMSRVALGHTGRPIVASRPVAWAFGALTLAAVARVLVPLFASGWYFVALLTAGTLWTIAFLVFLTAYLPILTGPRADGRPG
jgi:uncharacterized protein involved in response to NO